MPLNTLNRVLDIPQRKSFNAANLPLNKLVTGLREYMKTANDNAFPDTECIRFYTLNHLVGRMQAHFHPDEPLPDWAAEVAGTYQQVLVEQAQRMFSYVLLIITREARHQHEWSNNQKKAHALEMGEYAVPLFNFQLEIMSKNEVHAVSWLKDTKLDVPTAAYVHHIAWCFHHCGWSGGYGGKAWGKISDTLEGCVKGEYSTEVLVDLAYALAHNNGPIFNKGMLYKNYTHNFQRYLDLQRAGMLPAFFLSNELKDQLDLPSGLAGLAKQVATVQNKIGGLPTEFDFIKIKEFAPSGNKDFWSGFAKKQVAKTGASLKTPQEAMQALLGKKPAGKKTMTATSAVMVGAPDDEDDVPQPAPTWKVDNVTTKKIHPMLTVQILTRD